MVVKTSWYVGGGEPFASSLASCFLDGVLKVFLHFCRKPIVTRKLVAGWPPEGENVFR